MLHPIDLFSNDLSSFQLIFNWVSQMLAYYSLEKDSERKLMLDICNDYLIAEYNYFKFDISDKGIAGMKFLQLSDYKLFCKMSHINEFSLYIINIDLFKTHSLQYKPNKSGIVNDFYINGFENRIVKLLEFLKNAEFDDTLESIDILMTSNMYYFPNFQKIINLIKE